MQNNLFKMILITLSFVCVTAHAADLEPWQKDLNDFAQKVPKMTNGELRTNQS